MGQLGIFASNLSEQDRNAFYGANNSRNRQSGWEKADTKTWLLFAAVWCI